MIVVKFVEIKMKFRITETDINKIKTSVTLIFHLFQF